MPGQTTADTIDTFFNGAVVRCSNDPMLRHTDGTCRFEVEGVGSWLVRAEHGKLSVSEARGPAPADCTLTASEDDFLRMARGEQNPLTAFMQGRLQVTGQLALAERFADLFL
jgi:SCP-2 sterol transfer family